MAEKYLLKLKPEIREGFRNVHEMLLKARIERLKAQSYAELGAAAMAEAALAWSRAIPEGKSIKDIATQGMAYAQKILLAEQCAESAAKSIKAQKAFEEMADEIPSEEIWMENTIKEFQEKFGENAPKADKLTRRLTSLIGERESFGAMEIKPEAAIKRIDGEAAALMDELGELKTQSSKPA